MASFRDVYTREVEDLFTTLGRSKFEDILPDIIPQSRPIGDGNVQPSDYIGDGVIDIASFAAGIVPPRVVDALPTLPDTDYPQGALVFLTTDEKLYRNTDGSTWSVEVDGDDIIANSITAGQIAAGAIGTDELAADAVIANVVNVGGTVTIDENGITVTDGAITLEDYAGESVLTAFGFRGAWLGFLSDGVYNSSFDVGVTGTDLTNNNLIPDTTEEYEDTLSTELPGWHILKGDPNPGRLRLMTDTDALGGFALRFDNAAADANSRLASVFQDIPVLPGDELAVVLRWRYGASGAGNEVTRNITYSFVDADHEALTSLTSDGQIYSDSSDYATLVFPITDVVPNTARFLRLSVGFGCQGAGAALIDAIRLIRTNLEGMSLVSVGHSGGNTVEITPDEVSLLGSSILFGPSGGSADVALVRTAPNILFLNNGDDFSAEDIIVRNNIKLDGASLTMGSGGGAAADIAITRAAADTISTSDSFRILGSVSTKTKAGVPTDADVTGTAISGNMIVDTTNSRLYVRVGSTWKSAALT